MQKFFAFPFLFLILAVPAILMGQESKIDSFFTRTPFSLKASFQTGTVFPTNDFVKGANAQNVPIDKYNSFSLVFYKQTTGAKLWEQLYGYPIYGIGLYTGYFRETIELGDPISINGFLSGPFVRFQKLSFNYELGLGIAFNWNNFDPVNNPNNIAISANQSVFIEAGINLEYQFARRYYISAGYGFNHFSNGKIKMPNQGINTGALKFSLRYQINNPDWSFEKNEVPKYDKHFEWDINIYGGIQNITYTGDDADIIEKYEGMYFPVYGINNTFSRKVSYKSKIGAGFSLGYNGALNAQMAVENGELDEVDLPFADHIELSVYPSYELVINRLSIIIQPGFYIYRKKTEELSPAFYQRIGVKYHVWRDYFFGVNLHAYQFHVSDFIEWNIGRRINW